MAAAGLEPVAPSTTCSRRPTSSSMRHQNPLARSCTSAIARPASGSSTRARKHELAGVSFVAQANYADALRRDAVRVVSCNTTGLVRVLNALREHDLLTRARAVLIRRATDPWESHLGGLVNTLLPEPRVPSHQGAGRPNGDTDLDVVTIAAAGASTSRTSTSRSSKHRMRSTGPSVLNALEQAHRIVLCKRRRRRRRAELRDRDRTRHRPPTQQPVGSRRLGELDRRQRPRDLPHLPGRQRGDRRARERRRDPER